MGSGPAGGPRAHDPASPPTTRCSTAAESPSWGPARRENLQAGIGGARDGSSRSLGHGAVGRGARTVVAGASARRLSALSRALASALVGVSYAHWRSARWLAPGLRLAPSGRAGPGGKPGQLLPVCRWTLLIHPAQALPMYLTADGLELGLAYPAICTPPGRTLAAQGKVDARPEDLFYLVALPRLLCPFYQPISPSYLTQRNRPSLSLARVAGAVGLGVYAMVLGAVASRLHHWRVAPHAALLEVPAERSRQRTAALAGPSSPPRRSFA